MLIIKEKSARVVQAAEDAVFLLGTGRRNLALLLPLTLITTYTSTFQGAILKIVYGIDVGNGDERLAISRAATEAIAEATPGRSIVDVFPILRHIPSWLPGASFQKQLARCKIANDRLKDELFNEVKEAIVSMSFSL